VSRPFVLYSALMVALVLGTGWALYVLPTPGPLGPLHLAVGLIPSLVLLVGAVLAVSAARLAIGLIARGIAVVRRRH
jgi:hypothetical protein